MDSLKLALKDVLLDHEPSFRPDCIECSCGLCVDDHDQWIDHLLRDLTSAARFHRNPHAEPNQQFRRHPWSI